MSTVIPFPIRVPDLPPTLPAGTTPDQLMPLLDQVRAALLAHFAQIPTLGARVHEALENCTEDELTDESALDEIHVKLVRPSAEYGLLDPAWQSRWNQYAASFDDLHKVMPEWTEVCSKISEISAEMLALEDSIAMVVNDQVFELRTRRMAQTLN